MSTFEPSIPSMVRELEEEAAARGLEISIRTQSVPQAFAALQKGDAAAHDRLIAEAGAQFEDCDVLMLARFSMARAAAAFGSRPGPRLLTSPCSAVARLKRELGQAA